MNRIFVLIVILLAGCTLPQATPTLSPQPQPLTPTPTRPPTLQPDPTLPPETFNAVNLRFGVRGSASTVPEVEAGKIMVVEMDFEPVSLTVTRRADGSAASIGTRPGADIKIAQMRFCLGNGPACSGPGAWRPFEPSYATEINVDWLGPRPLFLEAEFRDVNGKPIPVFHSSFREPRPVAQVTLNVSGRILPNTPLDKLPSPVLTAAAATQMAFPVTGSVLIENGRCCAGGVAGAKIPLQVQFQAASTAGKVTEMKVHLGGGCVKDPAQLAGDAWEPLRDTKTYEAALALNWVGWWISVQYRDASGNLSPVYCDDISLEGSPARP